MRGEIGSRWEGFKWGLKDMLGILKNHLDPGALPGTGRGAWGAVALAPREGSSTSRQTRVVGSWLSSRVFPGPCSGGSGPEEPSQALSQTLQHPRVLQKTSLARCLGPHSLIILMPKCIKEAW